VPKIGTPAIQIDIEPESLGRNYPLQASVLGDAKIVLVRMLGQIDKSSAKKREAFVNSSAITIRQISSDVEIEAVAALATETSSLRPQSEFVALFTRDCAQPDQALLLGAFDDASLIGYARVAYFARRDNAPVNCAPSGWYLLGVVVHPKWVRQGLAMRLTTERLTWAAARSSEIFYVAKPDNVASIEMHRKLSFQEMARDVSIPPELAGLTLFRLSFEARTGNAQESIVANNLTLC